MATLITSNVADVRNEGRRLWWTQQGWYEPRPSQYVRQRLQHPDSTPKFLSSSPAVAPIVPAAKPLWRIFWNILHTLPARPLGCANGSITALAGVQYQSGHQDHNEGDASSCNLYHLEENTTTTCAALLAAMSIGRATDTWYAVLLVESQSQHSKDSANSLRINMMRSTGLHISSRAAWIGSGSITNTNFWATVVASTASKR